jgi:expansin (peptidoglycan-binding protein)
MTKMRSAYKIFVRKSEGKRHHLGVDGRITLKWNLKETWYGGLDWIHMEQDKVQWWALMNTVMNLRFPAVTINFTRRTLILVVSYQLLETSVQNGDTTNQGGV